MPEQARVEEPAAETRARPVIFPCFDGLRAIGAVMVLAHHVGNNTGDLAKPLRGTVLARFELALALLFMVSGFLLTRPFVAAHIAGRSRPRTGSYFRKRFVRIFPGYWLALLAVWFAFDDFSAPTLPNGTTDFLAYASLLYGYFFRFAIAPIQQAWTLNIELAFYFFLPFYAWVLGRFGRTAKERMTAHLVGLGALFVVNQVYVAAVLAGRQDRWEFRLHWLPGYLGPIVFGMALAVLSAGHEHGLLRLPRWVESPAFPVVSWGAAAAVFALLAYAFGLPNNRLEYGAGDWELVFLVNIVIAVLIVLPGVFGPQDQGVVRRFLRWRPIAFTGLVSYGVYLWHLAWIGPYYEWTGATRGEGGYPQLLVWTLGLSILSGALSFYLVERPAQRLGGSAAVNRKVGSSELAPRG